MSISPYASPSDSHPNRDEDITIRVRSKLAAKAFRRFRHYAFLCGGAWAGLSCCVMLLMASLLFRLHGDTKYGGSALAYFFLAVPALSVILGVFAARGHLWSIYGILAACYLAMLCFAIYLVFCGAMFFVPLVVFGQIALHAAAQHRRLLAEMHGIPPEYRG